MCGLAGMWQAEGAHPEVLRDQAMRMAATLVHRGPDDEGVWVDAEAGVALAFRRLAILDLSPAGHQPMVSGDGRYAIVFNGEIYNFRDLRAELERAGARFRSASDTEVILEGACRWGPRAAIERLWGMFAIALWDRHERTLTLARDRLGKKPLYLSEPRKGLLLFASELKALRAHPEGPSEVDRDALAAYVRFGCVPAPLAIYRGARKLEAGVIAEARPGRGLTTVRYWDPRVVAREGRQRPLALDDTEGVEQLEHRLGDAVARRMVADVPVGAFLSGGIDSSAVVALMQRQAAGRVRTFTIGFEEAGYDEAASARAVARHLGTDHTELYVTPAEALAVVPRLPDVYDEPFADSSQIPTLLVSQLARRSVTVALSGDGGDEVFGGYTRYVWADRIWRAMSRWPLPLRGVAQRGLLAIPPGVVDRWSTRLRALVPAGLRQSHAGEKLQKLALVLGAESDAAVYRRLVEQWPDAQQLVRECGTAVRTAIDDDSLVADLPDFVDRMMYGDLALYLPDDILTKVDRATMAVSLEARGPLLDHRLAEWAWRLPQRFRVRNGVGKWILRELLARHVPRALFERPKTGFGIPVGRWLRGPLRPWAEHLLEPGRLRREGYFEPAVIARLWQDHLRGRRDEQQRLWVVLMFQAWLDRWRP